MGSQIPRGSRAIRKLCLWISTENALGSGNMPSNPGNLKIGELPIASTDPASVRRVQLIGSCAMKCVAGVQEVCLYSRGAKLDARKATVDK
jgi:hypothetical protein